MHVIECGVDPKMVVTVGAKIGPAPGGEESVTGPDRKTSPFGLRVLKWLRRLQWMAISLNGTILTDFPHHNPLIKNIYKMTNFNATGNLSGPFES